MEAPATQQAGLELRDVRRSFVQAGERLDVLRGIELKIAPGEIVALVGPSGAGKSTLLQIAGLLERPDAGEVFLGGEPSAGLRDDARTAMRRHSLGFVFQFHHLLPEFTAVENIILPQLIAGLSHGEARMRALELLDMMGLSERETHRPAQLSGGEQQRVAIARAMANAPKVVLADEPTGNLDNHTGERVMNQLIKIIHQTGVAALVATHNMDLARTLDRVVRVEEGHLVEVKV